MACSMVLFFVFPKLAHIFVQVLLFLLVLLMILVLCFSLGSIPSFSFLFVTVSHIFSLLGILLALGLVHLVLVSPCLVLLFLLSLRIALSSSWCFLLSVHLLPSLVRISLST